MTLPSESTFTSIHNKLDDRAGFLFGVLCNFVACGADPETDAIRMGIKGNGSFPNYRFEKPSIRRDVVIRHGTFALPWQFNETPSRIFSGRSHREMSELDDRFWQDTNWSKATITFNELKALARRTQS